MITLSLYDIARGQFLSEPAHVASVPVPGPNTFICTGQAIYVVRAIVHTGYIMKGETEPRVTATVEIHAGDPLPKEFHLVRTPRG